MLPDIISLPRKQRPPRTLRIGIIDTRTRSDLNHGRPCCHVFLKNKKIQTFRRLAAVVCMQMWRNFNESAAWNGNNVSAGSFSKSNSNPSVIATFHFHWRNRFRSKSICRYSGRWMAPLTAPEKRHIFASSCVKLRLARIGVWRRFHARPEFRPDRICL